MLAREDTPADHLNSNHRPPTLIAAHRSPLTVRRPSSPYRSPLTAHASSSHHLTSSFAVKDALRTAARLAICRPSRDLGARLRGLGLRVPPCLAPSDVLMRCALDCGCGIYRFIPRAMPRAEPVGVSFVSPSNLRTLSSDRVRRPRKRLQPNLRASCSQFANCRRSKSPQFALFV